MEQVESTWRRSRGQPKRGYTPLGHLMTIPTNVQSTSAAEGARVIVVSNFFKLKTNENLIVWQYDVSFEPPVESVKARRAIIAEHKGLFDDVYIFDGNANIKSIVRLLNVETELVSNRKTDNEEIRITVKNTGSISFDHKEMIRLLNTQMRRNSEHLNFIRIGRHHFDPKSSNLIPEHNLNLWQGIITSINLHDGGHLCVCDITFKAVRMDTAYQVLQSVLREKRNTFHDSAKRELIGCVVMTSYNNRTYRIDGIDFDRNPMSTFERRNGLISFKEYYQEQYNLIIRDERQPLLQCLPSARGRKVGQEALVLLIPEFCTLTGLTDSLRSDFSVRSKLTAITRLDPNTRIKKLVQFIRQMNSNSNVQKEMNDWGVKLEDKLVELPSRELNPEKIYMQADRDETASVCDRKTGDFLMQIRGKQFQKPVCLRNWGIVVLRKDEQCVIEFANTLNRVCQPMGIQMNRPSVVYLDNDRIGAYVEVLKKVPSSYDMVVIIVPNSNKDRYDAIKKVMCIDHPIPSQVIVSYTLSKSLMSVCTKVGIQMSAKLGAEIWSINLPPVNTIVVGYDWYRDSTRGGQRVGGFVCSLNQKMTRWFSRASFHKENNSVSTDFNTCLTLGIKKYAQDNGRLPDRLIIYRDGVSEGQIAEIFELELAKIKEILETIGGSQNKIRMSYVIVTKRINVRFFSKLGEQQFGNPNPGTVVDTVVTRKNRFDFYLISQSVRHGTVAPTMYNIIESDTNWKAEHHQQLAYKLTHLYYNWPGTIRVPAPVMYAKKLAFLTANSLHKEAHSSLSDRLFYL